jgi:ABC-type transporter Mla subunit MlaD
VSRATDERLATRVGGVALVLIAAAIGFVVVLLPRLSLHDHRRVRVYFHHAGGLREGAAVVVAGSRVGTVEAIARSPRGAPGPLGGDEGVVVIAAIEERRIARVSERGEFFVASRGPLSERYLEVAPPRGDPGGSIADGAERLGGDPTNLDRAIQRTWDNLQRFGAFVAEVAPPAHELRQQLAALTANLAAVSPQLPAALSLAAEVAALRTTSTASWRDVLGGDGGLARLRGVLAQGQVTVIQARAMIATLAARLGPLGAAVEGARSVGARRAPAIAAGLDLTIARITAALDRIEPLLAGATALADRLARGEGSLGRLMRDPEFPEDAKELGKILKRQPWRIFGHPQDDDRR